MKKTSIFALLMIAVSFMAKGQATGTFYPLNVWDGMDSITVTYNPFGSGGAHGDTAFQTFTGNLYAYCYLTDSTPGSGGHIGTYNNGTWAGASVPIDQFTRVSAHEWTWTLPNVRQFFSVPPNVYVTGVNIIVKTAVGDTQSANLYLPVVHTGVLSDTVGQAWSTGPNTILPSTFLATGTENAVVYYHPQNDTSHYSGTSDGDVIFKHYNGTIYTYTYAIANTAGVLSYPALTSWGSVGTTPADSMVQIDTNDYVFDIKNVLGDFVSLGGMSSGATIDTIAFIPRTATGDTQTVNLYIPLLVSAALNVTNVNTNDASVKIYPNPATTGMIVAYSFAQQAEATVTVTDLLGQTVMTHDLGKNMAGNMYLSLDGIPSGIYLVTVSNGISEKVIRLAKQ